MTPQNRRKRRNRRYVTKKMLRDAIGRERKRVERLEQDVEYLGEAIDRLAERVEVLEMLVS